MALGEFGLGANVEIDGVRVALEYFVSLRRLDLIDWHRRIETSVGEIDGAPLLARGWPKRRSSAARAGRRLAYQSAGRFTELPASVKAPVASQNSRRAVKVWDARTPTPGKAPGRSYRASRGYERPETVTLDSDQPLR